ncbi:hypothetical protein O181_090886 [Austropuccinia psidii MF-1]|uniref:Reverse transcriptase RNase H-like domain-containing protein n=1 Tax=Austropuccinia psidii MF-1 TaxID=1389203 RepID=A0A9Q3IWC0_9BASI|nr:hypothetical protein [Austropuccinia psidii MF-1]
MDLPPLSFHASLEEKWDEEGEPEEIETVLKVVPPAYHQYLDVFSKVKAEKLSPHHACDHHIELEGLLPPVNDSGKHPIAFYSHNLLPDELKYEIHDKELLGIVWTLKCWRAFLLSLSDSFEVLKDHSSLQYFMSSKVLTCCQARWADFLSEFHFSITYFPGRLAILPDAVSHWDNMYPERGVDFISKNPQNFHPVLNHNEIKESRFFSIKVEVFLDLVDQIQKTVLQDKDYK